MPVHFAALVTGLKLERRAERKSVPGKLWTAADERALRKKKSGAEEFPGEGSAKSGKSSWEGIPGVTFAKGKGKSNGKSKGGYPLDFCRNCNFSVLYDELAAVQVVNGLVVNFDQIKGTKAIGICDTCKVCCPVCKVILSFGMQLIRFIDLPVLLHGCWKNGCFVPRRM